MRRYDVVSGILFILSIIDFALAAPVFVQEKRQACVDVVRIPKDVITVLEERGEEELGKLVEGLLKTGEKPVESSDAHASSSSALPGSDHGSTNVVQTPAPNPASSTAYPDQLEPPSMSSTAPTQLEGDDELHGILYALTSTGDDSDHELTGAHAPQPTPNKRPATDPDDDFDWDYWTNMVDPRPPKRLHVSTNVEQAPAPNPASSTAKPDPLMEPSGPSSTAPIQGGNEVDELLHTLASTGYDSDHELTGSHAPQLNPNKRPLTEPDPNFDWNYWANLEDPKTPGPAPPKRPKSSDQASEYQVEHVQQPKPGPSTDQDFDWVYWTNLKDSPPTKLASLDQASEYQVEHVQQPKPGPSTDQDFDWDYWMNLKDPPSTKPASLGQADEKQVEHAQMPNPLAGPSTDSDFEFISLDDLPPPGLASLEEGLGQAHEYHVLESSQLEGPSRGPSTTHGLPEGSDSEPEDEEVLQGPPTTPELHSDHQGSQPLDLQAAIYAAKGKAKESRRVSGATRDTGHVA